MRERKLRSSLNWQGTLKQKGVKQMAVKQGLGVFRKVLECCKSTNYSCHTHLISLNKIKHNSRLPSSAFLSSDCKGTETSAFHSDGRSNRISSSGGDAVSMTSETHCTLRHLPIHVKFTSILIPFCRLSIFILLLDTISFLAG
jgi:hypothetical protein